MKSKSAFWIGVAAFAFLLNIALPAQGYYNPNAGRWLSRDPISERGGVNLNGFVANQTLGRIDRLGLENPIMGPTGPQGPSTGWPDPSIFLPPNLNVEPRRYPDPNYVDARNWLKKCHPEFNCPSIQLGMPSSLTGFSALAITIVNSGQSVSDYVDTLVHECLHMKKGPAFGAVHDVFYDIADEVRREFERDPQGKNCRPWCWLPKRAEPPPRTLVITIETR